LHARIIQARVVLKSPYGRRVSHLLFYSLSGRIDIARDLSYLISRLGLPAQRLFPRIFAKQETGLTLSHHPIHLDLYEYFFAECKKKKKKKTVIIAPANNRSVYYVGHIISIRDFA